VAPLSSHELSSHEQRFSFGYHIIPWDLGGEPLAPALDFLALQGVQWFEALLGDTVGRDYARQAMTLGPVRLPAVVPDFEIFSRLALFSGAYQTAGVRLASIYMDCTWLNEHFWPYERARAQVLARILRSCDAPILVTGGGPADSARDSRPQTEYHRFASRLREVGLFSASLGIRTVYHPHLDTFVETREQLDRLMDVLDLTAVGLCIDPAHFHVMHSDPVDIFRVYGKHIDYVHLKDCRDGVGPNDGVARYEAFCELGMGAINISEILGTLLESAYEGLIIIEQDYAASPNESCIRNLSYVTNTLGLRINP
jgi:inosose dehydratase